MEISDRSDKARFLATLYIEDIGDLIKDAITPFFGFSRYAEKLGRAAHSFSPLEQALQQPENLIEQWMLELLEIRFETCSPTVIGLTIPFPGNLYAALKCGQWIRKRHPQIRIVAGGGYVNTELRSLSDPAVFDYLDFITLDDGELPFLHILQVLDEERSSGQFTRTFIAVDKGVRFVDSGEQDISPRGHRLPGLFRTSPGPVSFPHRNCQSHAPSLERRTLEQTCPCPWLLLAQMFLLRHFPRLYQTLRKRSCLLVLVDRIEQIIRQTGRTGFHFVDEAAPPAVLKNLALELLRRRITISWWANIRFEAGFHKRPLPPARSFGMYRGDRRAGNRIGQAFEADEQRRNRCRQAARACANFRDAGIHGACLPDVRLPYAD